MPLLGEGSLLDFPCDFPIKVMGRKAPGFAQAITDIVRRHAPDFDAASVQTRPSKGDRYLALTLVVHASSRAQLDAIYHDLTACEDVAMAL